MNQFKLSEDGTKLVQLPGLEKPKLSEYGALRLDFYNGAMDMYKEHLASLLSYDIAEPNLKHWASKKIFIKDVDFNVSPCSCDKYVDSHTDCGKRGKERTPQCVLAHPVAIPEGEKDLDDQLRSYGYDPDAVEKRGIEFIRKLKSQAQRDQLAIKEGSAYAETSQARVIAFKNGWDACTEYLQTILSQPLSSATEANVMREALEKINCFGEDQGTPGGKYGDTEYDSMSAAYGYNVCLHQVHDIARKALSSPVNDQTKQGAGSKEEQDPDNGWDWVAMFFSALMELVELKDIKDHLGKTPDYEQRQPIAWETAKRIIKLWFKTGEGANKFPTSSVQGWVSVEEKRLKEICYWLSGEPDEEAISRALLIASGDEYINNDGWINAETNPKEQGRYLCYVSEVNDLGISHFVWNCCYNGSGNWSDNLRPIRVTHWQPFPQPPKQ